MRCIRFSDWNEVLTQEQLAINGAHIVEGTSKLYIPGTQGQDFNLTDEGLIVKRLRT